MHQAKIVIIAGYAPSLVNFRGSLISELVDKGMSVIVAYPENEADENLSKQMFTLGITRQRQYPLMRNGINPLSDLMTFIALWKIFQTEKPDIILSYTIKPVIWGGLAARFVGGNRFFALITGLGFAFQSGSFKRRTLMFLVKTLYRSGLSKAQGVIFQNPDNLSTFLNEKLVSKSRSSLVNGSGVDLEKFAVSPIGNVPRFLLIARLLGEKGIREYVNAAEIVKKFYPETVLDLVGPEDPSPDGIPIDEVMEWHRAGTVVYHGPAEDVRPYLEKCSIYVLPSYHEGMPRTVLEAMAIGRPILTTRVPGCKETVQEGVNGWLVEKGNAKDLAEKMIWFIEHPEQWESMGTASREIAQEKFDVSKVNADILRIMGLSP